MSRSIHLALISFLFACVNTLAIYIISLALSIHLGARIFSIIFIVSGVLAYLVFYFSYELTLNRRIKKNIFRLSSLYQQEKKEKQTLVNIPDDKIDPIKELENEINLLEKNRQEEVEQLKKLENHRKEYLGNVSHELKTPIFNIQGYVSTLIEGGLHDESINLEYLKRADKSVDRMIHIVDDLETISQLESGVLELEEDRFDILDLVKDIFVSLEMQAFTKKITFGFLEPYTEPIYVYADKFRIRQVMVNLITNSLKYGKEGGKTIVGFLAKDDEKTVYITDNGIGVEPQHVPRLFERFYRVDKGRSREQGGTGLGLAIVKHIIEAHHQTIKVSSKVGEGTTFSFTLKRA